MLRTLSTGSAAVARRPALEAASRMVFTMLALLMALTVALGPQARAQQEPPVDPGAEAETAPDDADLETLIRILEDDAARARLIERLRAAGTPEAAQLVEPSDESLAARLAVYTREAAEGAAELFAAATSLIRELTDVTDGALNIDFDALWGVVLGVAMLVAATLAVFVVLRLAFGRLQRRIAGAAARGDLVKRVKMTGASIVLDVATVVLAWGVGYVFAMNIGQTRQIGLDQSLFLNAFLIVELIKAAVRTVLAPRWTSLRPVRVDDTTAAYWYFWLSRLISLIGYAFLFIAPMLAAGVSADVAEAVRVIVMLTALVIAIAIILQNREAVRDRLVRRAASGRSDPLSRTLATVGRVWHVAAIVYLVAVFALWLADPGTALPFVLSATWKSAVAILLGTMLTSFISRMASGGMRLPEDLKARLPLLEARLNAFVPGVLRVVSAIVTIAVLVTIAEVWNIANIGE